MDVEKLSLKDEKTILRVKFRDLRKKYAAEAAQSSAAGSLRKNIDKWMSHNTSGSDQICAYRAAGDEPDCVVKPLTELYFPRIDGNSLAFYRPAAADAFIANNYGILEPVVEGAEALNLSKPAVVFTPAVAVDSLGRRIGSGRGFYDRFFHATPKAVRVGVVYQIQVSQNPLPGEGWDQPLDWIITDNMILRVSGRSS